MRRMTEQMGMAVEAVQTEESVQPDNEEPCERTEKRLAISADGAYVPLVGGEWTDVRTVVIGEVGPAVQADQKEGDRSQQDVHVTQLS